MSPNTLPSPTPMSTVALRRRAERCRSQSSPDTLELGVRPTTDSGLGNMELMASAETTLMNYVLQEQHSKKIAVILNGSSPPPPKQIAAHTPTIFLPDANPLHQNVSLTRVTFLNRVRRL